MLEGKIALQRRGVVFENCKIDKIRMFAAGVPMTYENKQSADHFSKFTNRQNWMGGTWTFRISYKNEQCREYFMA
jgi:hypothetical protein